VAWIPIIAWLAAAVVAVVVLGFCAYELRWKVRRVRTDLGQLLADAETLDQLRDGIADAQLRFARTGVH
jgi:outer membrane murein-binding lipoprotein Lpp